MLTHKKLNANDLTEFLLELIESEPNIDLPRHIKLIQYLNEFSVLGYPPLIEASQNILSNDAQWMSKWMSQPLQSVLERITSGISEPHPVIPKRFERAEEDHLFAQMKSLIEDMKLMSIVKLQDHIDKLRDQLLFEATAWLLEIAHHHQNDRLSRILINISEILGDILQIQPHRFQEESTNLLINGLQECHLAGGILSIVLPEQCDQAQVTQLKESGLLSDLRGVEHLILDGYGALSWLESEVKQGLKELVSLDVKVLSDHEYLRVVKRKKKSRKKSKKQAEKQAESTLFDQIKVGVSKRESRGRLTTNLLEKIEQLNLSTQLKESALFIAERVSAVVMSKVNQVEVLWVYCPSGTFWMGADYVEKYDNTNEQPRHKVKISKPFWVGQTLVTQTLWKEVMKDNPSRFTGETLPVEQVTWEECIKFCNQLSVQEGLDPVYEIVELYDNKSKVSADLSRNGYRLPTEAEWEYMAKAGTEFVYAGSNQIDKVAWYGGRDDYSEGNVTNAQTQPVAQKKPNAWGIYDCSGNVLEWCSDQWKSDYEDRVDVTTDPHEWIDACVYLRSQRVCRNGSWYGIDQLSRVARRKNYHANFSGQAIGFRIIRN